MTKQNIFTVDLVDKARRSEDMPQGWADDDSKYCPLIDASDDAYYSFWEYDKVLSANDRAVLDKFSKLLHDHDHINITLQPDDILIINNRRMCHGRTEIRGTKNRHLKRYWISKQGEA